MDEKARAPRDCGHVWMQQQVGKLRASEKILLLRPPQRSQKESRSSNNKSKSPLPLCDSPLQSSQSANPGWRRQPQHQTISRIPATCSPLPPPPLLPPGANWGGDQTVCRALSSTLPTTLSSLPCCTAAQTAGGEGAAAENASDSRLSRRGESSLFYGRLATED